MLPTWKLEVGTWRVLYEVKYAELWRENGLKLPVDAGFVSDRAPATAARSGT